jgi:hypothetical protein
MTNSHSTSPTIHSNLATSNSAQRNHPKETHYLLLLCFISDPVVYPSRVNPIRIGNLIMLTMDGITQARYGPFHPYCSP